MEFSGAEEAIVTLARLLHKNKQIKLCLCSTRFINNHIKHLPFEDSYTINRKKPLSIEELYSTLLNPLNLIRNLRHCLDVADDFQPDVIHSGIFTSALPSVIIAKRLQLPVIEHIHDYRTLCLTDLPFLDGIISQLSYSQELRYYLKKVEFYKATLAIGFRRLFYSLYNQCDLLIAVSNFVKKTLSPYLKPPIKVLYNAVDVENEKRTEKGKHNKISLVYSGRLSAAKGFPLFLKASELLLKNGVDMEIHITGMGELELLANRFAKAFNKNVYFHGFLPRNKLYDLVKNSNVTVHPSLWPEPCPLSIIKSVELGTTALASNRGGIPELLSPKYLFYPKQADLHNKLCEFFKNPDKFPPSLAVDTSPETIVNRLVDIYKLLAYGGM